MKISTILHDITLAQNFKTIILITKINKFYCETELMRYPQYSYQTALKDNGKPTKHLKQIIEDMETLIKDLQEKDNPDAKKINKIIQLKNQLKAYAEEV